MANHPEPPVVFIQRQGSSMVGEDQPAGGVVLDPLATVLRVDLANLRRDHLTKPVRRPVLLSPTFVDLVNDTEKTAGQPIVEPTLQQPNKIKRSGDITCPKPGQNASNPVSSGAM